MHELRSTAQEAAEDIFFGQAVIHWARWFIIGAGIVLALWTITETNKLVLGILPVVALMAINFYLHGRQLAERPANPALITATCLLDLAVISVAVLFWPGQGGLPSPAFVLYYPVVLAFAFVMPPRLAVAYTISALIAYTGICLLADASFIADVGDVKALLVRLITLGAMGGLGAWYWRIQRDRRRRAVGEPAAMRPDRGEGGLNKSGRHSPERP
jgi:hypothetical protein